MLGMSPTLDVVPCWLMHETPSTKSIGINALELPPFLVPMQPICVQPLSPPTHCLYVGATC